MDALEMLKEKNWAVIGASIDKSKFSYKIPKILKEKGYKVYLINPKYYEIEGRTKLNGVIVDFYKVYKGSSDYDTKEMSILIDGVVSDCKELKIPTLDDIKISQLKSNWG